MNTKSTRCTFIGGPLDGETFMMPDNENVCSTIKADTVYIYKRQSASVFVIQR